MVRQTLQTKWEKVVYKYEILPGKKKKRTIDTCILNTSPGNYTE